MLTCAIISFGVITNSSELRAQASFNTTLLGHLQFVEHASDIWGYVDDSTGIEYAIMGLFTGTSIIDVSTDPANPTEVAFVPGPSSIWRDIKTHSHYAYVVNETSGGLQIIDLSQPDSAFEVTSIDFLFTRAHNLYIDDGFAYVVGTSSDNGGIWIFDLANPEAPNPVGLWSTAYVHDIYVRNDTAYAAAIREDGSVYILDVADKSSVIRTGKSVVKADLYRQSRVRQVNDPYSVHIVRNKAERFLNKHVMYDGVRQRLIFSNLRNVAHI